jgi:hypothetical protein
MNSKNIKEYMNTGLVAIGVIVVVALIGWVAFEVLNVREEIGRGLSWMSVVL